jgi:high-affinity Fe2+/Pb2+ permease
MNLLDDILGRPPVTPRKTLAAVRRHAWGLAALAVLIGAGVALAWTTQAYSGLDLLSYPYGDKGDTLERRLLLALLAALVIAGLFGVVAWLADLQSAQMSRRGQHRARRLPAAKPPGGGVG